MPSAVASAAAEAWQRVLARAGAPLRGPSAVHAPDADRVASTLRAAGVEGPIHAASPPVDPGTDGPGSPALTILLHAWGDRRNLDRVVRTAAARLREGGILIVGDLDAERLVRATPKLYPAASLYRRSPDVAAWLVDAGTPPEALEVAMIRSGLGHKQAIPFDWPVRGHADPATLRTGVLAGMWRGHDRLAAADRDAVVRAAGLGLGPQRPIIELEPWHLVTGRRLAAGG